MFHRILPDNDSARIKGEVLENILSRRRTSSMTLKGMTNEYYKNCPNEYKFSKSTIHNFIRNRLGYTFRKTPVKNNAYFNNNTKISKLVFLKKYIQAIKNDYMTIFYDECLFTLNNSNFRAWRKDGQNFEYTGAERREKSMLLLACTKNDIVYYQFTETYIDSDEHMKALSALMRRVKSLEQSDNGIMKGKYLLFCDNATCHVSKATRRFCKFKNLKVITSPPYHSTYNAAELVFRHLKNKVYKRNFTNMYICFYN